MFGKRRIQNWKRNIYNLGMVAVRKQRNWNLKNKTRKECNVLSAILDKTMDKQAGAVTKDKERMMGWNKWENGRQENQREM